MVKSIVKDIEILQQKSERFVFGEDEHLVQDMIDTAHEHIENCVGLACIQIGVPKRVILVKMGEKFIPFINPTIIQRSKETFLTNEGCLSLDGEKEVRRHRRIKLGYTTLDGKTKVGEFGGFAAQIIQHECDHLNGILIKENNNQLKQQLAESEARIACREDNIKFKEADINQLKWILEGKKKDIDQLKQQLAEKNQAIENWKTMYESVMQTCNNDAKEIERLNKLLAEKDKEIEVMKQMLVDREETITVAEKSNKGLILNYNQLKKELDEMKKKKNYYKKKYKETLELKVDNQNQTAIAELEKVKVKLNEEINNASVLLDPVEYEDYHELLGVIRGYKLSVDQIDQQIKSLKGDK